MATEISTQIEFPANPKRTAEMFCTESYLKLKCSEHAHSAFSVKTDGSTAEVTCERTFNDIPDTFKTFVGSELTLIEFQSWNVNDEGFHCCDVSITVREKPVSITGTITLEPHGSGTRLNLDGVVKVGIPLFGGMIEGLVRDHVNEILQDEQAIGLQWLSENH